jgi:hypothetical protein
MKGLARPALFPDPGSLSGSRGPLIPGLFLPDGWNSRGLYYHNYKKYYLMLSIEKYIVSSILSLPGGRGVVTGAQARAPEWPWPPHRASGVHRHHLPNHPAGGGVNGD